MYISIYYQNIILIAYKHACIITYTCLYYIKPLLYDLTCTIAMY